MSNLETINKYLDNDHNIIIIRGSKTDIFFEFEYKNSKGKLSECEMIKLPELDIRFTMDVTYDLINHLTEILNTESLKTTMSKVQKFHCKIRPEEYIEVYRLDGTVVIEMSTLYIKTKQELTIVETEQLIIELGL